MNFPPRAGRVSGRATPSLRHAPRAKLQRTNPGSSPLSLRGIPFRRSGPALSPTSMQACRSPFGSIFPRIGPPARFAEQRLACPRTSCSRPNRKSPLTRSRPRAPKACRRASCWRNAGYGINTAFRTALTRMGLTYTTARCATHRAHRIARMGAGARSRLRISMIGSDHRDPVLCRRHSVVGAALAARIRSAPAQGMERARSPADPDAARQADNSPNRCRPTPGVTSPGVTSPGAKASTKLCIPGSPACACGRRIATPGARSPIRKNDCLSNGRRAKALRPNTGFRPCRPMPTSRRIVATAKMRWRIERDHQELKPGTRPRSL